jgi:hypothetical protein
VQRLREFVWRHQRYETATRHSHDVEIVERHDFSAACCNTLPAPLWVCSGGAVISKDEKFFGVRVTGGGPAAPTRKGTKA